MLRAHLRHQPSATGFTHDVDVTIAVDAANRQRVEAALQALHAQPYLPGPCGSSYRTSSAA